MTSVNWERWGRATGIGFVVLFVIGFIVVGEQPGVNDSAQQIASYYEGDRGRILTGAVLIGVATLLLLWFVGAIANLLREAGEGRLAATTVATGATFVGIILVVIVLNAGLAYKTAGDGDEGVIQALYVLSWACGVVASIPLAGLIAAATVGLWRAGLADWFGWAGLAAAIVMLLGGTTWAREGFWAPDGGYSYVTIVVGLGWTLVASGLLYMRMPAAERAPETAAARPM